MRDRIWTSKNEFLYKAAVTIASMLPPNPYRKAFMLSPIAGGPGVTAEAALIAVAFGQGANQTWTVPNNVTSVVDMYGWGSGGNSGAAGAANGGGGGGGGAFGSAGPLTVVPGSVFTINVDIHNGAGLTTIVNPIGTTIVSSASGTAGALAVKGTGGAAGTGVIKTAGAAGANGTAPAGGGGGGAGGNNGAGTAGAGTIGGAGGGGVVLSTYGLGGGGGTGGGANVAGSPGLSPGGGGGGGGSTTGAVGLGSDGLVVVFYPATALQQAISISMRNDCLLGNGIINFSPGTIYPVIVADNEIGSIICEEWFCIAGLAGQTFNVCEYSYLPDEVDPVF